LERTGAGHARRAPFANLAVTARNGTFSVDGPMRPDLRRAGRGARLLLPMVQVNLVTTLEERRARRGCGSAPAPSRSRPKACWTSAKAARRLQGRRPAAGTGAIMPNLKGRDVRVAMVLNGGFGTPIVAYDLQAAALGFDKTVVEGPPRDRARAGRRRPDGRPHLGAGAANHRPQRGGGRPSDQRRGSTAASRSAARASLPTICASVRTGSTPPRSSSRPCPGQYRAGLQGRINNYLVRGIGLVDVQSNMDVVTQAGGFGISGRIALRTRRIDNASARDFLGGNAIVTTNINMNPAGVITFNNFRLAAPLLRITSGSGTYSPDGRVNARLAGISTAYGPISLVVTGTATAPDIRIRATRPGFGLGLTNVEARIRSTGRGYEITATGQSQYGPFVADVLVLTGRGPLTLEIRRLTIAGFTFSGRVVQTPAGPLCRNPPSQRPGPQRHRQALGGRKRSARRCLRAGQRRADSGRNPDPHPARHHRSDGHPLSDRAFDRRRRPAGRAQARRPSGPDRPRPDQLSRGPRPGAGRGSRIERCPVPNRLQHRADAEPHPRRRARQCQPHQLPPRPSSRRPEGGSRVAARSDDNRPSARQRPSRRQVRQRRGHPLPAGQSRSRHLQRLLTGLGLGGRANGSLEFTQPAGTAFPRADARINIDNFTRTGIAVASTPVNLAMVGTLRPEGGAAAAVIRRGGNVIGRAQVRLQPVAAGGSWVTSLMAAPLAGGIRYNGPAQVLWSLAGIADQQLSGPIGVAADFSGRVQNPQFTGIVRANSLTFEDENYGTRITNLALQGRFTSSTFEITQLSGRAGRGTVTGRGSVGLAAAAGFPIDIRLNFDNAQLARGDAIGATATGEVAITNSRAGGALISGDLTLPEVRYQIVRQGAAEVAELEGVRRRGDPLVRPDQVNQQATAPSIWKLDLRVRADNQVFVEGMGLESEWQTDLRIRGTSASPQMVGEAKVIRGTFSFAGQRFELTTGEVQFTGSQPINPRLNIRASGDVKDVTITMGITGSSTNPQIAFSSSPALPQDEIMARLLFGGSVTELSALQLVQVGLSLNSLRGGGGGLNPLGKLRSAGGLSRLRILGADEATGRGTALAAGFYIGRNVYLELITDARGFTATQLEVALSKSLSILSQAGSFGGSSVNVRYRKQY
jgi:translocation and assembly module TamB